MRRGLVQAGLLTVALGAARANAQSLPSAAPAVHGSLPPVPQLRLSWPIAPLSQSFSQLQLRGYAAGSLQLFRLESLWLRLPSLQLLTVARIDRATELDCRLTCQPVLQRAVDLEAHVPLGGFSTAVPASYAFVRSSGLATPQTPRFTRQFGVGVAGALSF